MRNSVRMGELDFHVYILHHRCLKSNLLNIDLVNT